MDSPFPKETITADFCVVGGGIAGMTMALECARAGFRVVLMHDRPVPGGNASGECRVQISGADRLGKLPNLRETGILEELRLENCRLNPDGSYSVWDMVLWSALETEPNLQVLYNCSCRAAVMAGNRIKTVTGWQTTTQKEITVAAKLFADCSGDAVLAPLTGADFRVGREARGEFGETIGPETADRRTMGMSCIFQTRRCDTPQPFEKPAWAHTYCDDSELPCGADGHANLHEGYWWVELGGECDSIADTEALRPELLKILLGVWDHIKNRGDHGAEHLALEWIQFLPSKRESRRYVGDHILTQRDIEAGGRFPDTVAYGGWTMDDHNPAGFRSAALGEPVNIHHPAPSPYGIPYRCLYSRNLDNLFVGGRCVSVTHAALSSTRVIGTCSAMAQAAGGAAAIALRRGISPREVGQRHLAELQQLLLRRDCYLPGVRLELPELAHARISGTGSTPEALRDGVTRVEGGALHQWRCRSGDQLTVEWDAPQHFRRISLIFESGMQRRIALVPGNPDCLRLPPELAKAYRLEARSEGRWRTLAEVSANARRRAVHPAEAPFDALRLTLQETYGAAETGLHALLAE